MSADGVVAAWQAALVAEQRAAFGYGLLGPRLDSGAEVALARAAQTAHEQRCDDTAQALAAAGHPPGQASPLDVPAAVTTVAAARTLAVRLEDAAASAWRYLYAQAANGTPAQAPGVRAAAQAGLTDAAVLGARWRRLLTPAHATRPFPGV